MMFKHICVSYLLFILIEILLASRCYKNINKTSLKFKLIRRHSRASQLILSEKTLLTVKQCQEFAILKNALAFNFYSLKYYANSKINITQDHHNCQVIACPALKNAYLLVSDDKFSYYSLYSRRNMPVNDSVMCLPRIGLFITSMIFKNYSNAQAECTKIPGKLAHIVDAERSVGLAKYIGDTPTFVGLSNQGKERQWKNEYGESLSCFDYRAWAPGEPTSRGCVTLTKSSTNSSTVEDLPIWKVVACTQTLPYICEMLPSFSST